MRLAGLVIFAGAVQFWFCMLLAECLYPGYSVSGNWISDLGVGPTAILFNLSVFLLGASLVAGAYLLREFRVFPIFLLLCGVGAMGVGIFPERPHGRIHTAFSVVSFLFGSLSVIFSRRVMKPPLSHLALLLGLLSMTCLILLGAGVYLHLGRGGMERMVAYPLLLWGVGLGGHLMGEASGSAGGARVL
ncbi:MAG: DUF998 domain-containing protein [Candidatus Hadarchaeales archaeon]